MSPCRPTIVDVAAASGVSKSTVSNVVRGAAGVSADTRSRVLAAVESLGYRPNAAARNLVQRRTNLIGVVVWDLANAFDAELVKRLEQAASAGGYTTVVANTGGHPELEASRIDALESVGRRVPGDVSVVGFDGTDLGAHPRIGLTTVAQPRGELIARGLGLLRERLAGGGDGPRGVRLQGELVVRASTGAP